MTTLKFDDEKGPMHFEFIWEGFVLGGSLVKEKGITILRQEIRILDKLESVSIPFPCGKQLPTGEPARKLEDEDIPLDFEDADIDLIRRYMSLVPWSTGKAVRNFMDTFDWLRLCMGVENESTA